jgi:hypothetical protein
MDFKEYLKSIAEPQVDELLKDEEIDKIFKTPFGKLDVKYRNLISNPGELEGEEKVGEYYTKSGKSLEYIIRNHLNFEDDFDDDWDEDVYYEPYFVYIEDTNEPCGYLVYEWENKNSSVINNVILFSFDVSRKDFGKQIWVDFEKDLAKKVKEGYIINWRSKKTNLACLRYDVLINKFKGVRYPEGDYWVYRIGGEE